MGNGKTLADVARDQRRKRIETAQDQARLTRQPVALLVETVEPNRLEAKCGGTGHVPSIGRDEADPVTLQPQPVAGKLVDRWVRYVNTHILNVEHQIQTVTDTGAINTSLLHGRSAVGQYGGAHPGPA